MLRRLTGWLCVLALLVCVPTIGASARNSRATILVAVTASPAGSAGCFLHGDAELAVLQDGSGQS